MRIEGGVPSGVVDAGGRGDDGGVVEMGAATGLAAICAAMIANALPGAGVRPLASSARTISSLTNAGVLGFAFVLGLDGRACLTTTRLNSSRIWALRTWADQLELERETSNALYQAICA